MKTEYILLILALLILPLSGTAQPLDSLWMMLEGHPQLEALNARRNAALARGEQQAAWPEPMVSTSWFALPVETRLGPQILRVGASQDIPWKGALDNRRAMAENQSRIPEWQSEATRAQLEEEIALAWHELFGLREKGRLLQEEKQWLLLRIELTRQRVSQGLARIDALYLLEMDVAAIDAEIAGLAIREGIPTARINRALSRNQEEPVRTPIISVSPEWPAGDIPDFDGHPAVAGWEFKKAAARLEMEQTRWDRNPYLNAGLDYIIVGQRDDADPDGNGRDIIAPRVGIRLPIARQKYRSKDQEQQWNLAEAEAGQRQVREQLQSEWQIARAQFDEAAQIKGQLFIQVDWAKKTLPVLLQAWAEGKASMEEVLQVHRRIWKLEQSITDQQTRQFQALAKARALLITKSANQ